MGGLSINLHCCCFVVWPCWPAPRRSPSRCPPASPEPNAPAAATGGWDGGQPSSGPSRWRKYAVFWSGKDPRLRLKHWTGNLLACMRLKFSCWFVIFKSLQCPHLSRSAEYFSTPTSLGRGGREEGLGCPADAASAGLLWEDGGERRGLVALLVPSTGWKELPIFISTSGPLSSDEKAVTKKHSNHDFW